MSNGIEITWHDATTAEIQNHTGKTLTKVRIQVVGDTRVAGRREWTHDVENWTPGSTVRLVRIDPRGNAPQVRMRFHVGSDHQANRQWFTDALPLTPPSQMLDEDPWSLMARTRRAHQ